MAPRLKDKLHEKILLGVQIKNLDKQLERQVRHALRMLAPYLKKIKTNSSLIK